MLTHSEFARPVTPLKSNFLKVKFVAANLELMVLGKNLHLVKNEYIVGKKRCGM